MQLHRRKAPEPRFLFVQLPILLTHKKSTAGPIAKKKKGRTLKVFWVACWIGAAMPTRV